MNELIFVLLICPLFIFIVSVIGTRKTKTYYVMPIVTFASFFNNRCYRLYSKIFLLGWHVQHLLIIVSYMTLLFVKGYEVAENAK
ncbi:DUF2651 family protein [Bacillus paranthracis]